MRRSRTVLHGLTGYRDVYMGATMTSPTDCSPPNSIGSLRWCPQARANQLSCKVCDGLLHFSTLLVVFVLVSVYSPHASTCLHCQFHPALFFAAFKGGLRQASDDQGASSIIPRAPVPVLETQESDRSAAAEPSADAAPEVQESPNVDPPTESLRSRSDILVVSVAVAAAAPAAVHSAGISAAAASSSSSAPAQAPPPPLLPPLLLHLILREFQQLLRPPLLQHQPKHLPPKHCSPPLLAVPPLLLHLRIIDGHAFQKPKKSGF
uniref:Uncharacterized protein n=1 Tax=Chromera velia CCMP2878 TaxID=1169474 RepID=A0A0G4I3E2_9ALVE|eukprot:Cvel_35448.t1-p1 / transcript=Cvel_35448.t1 / gene=Cvel_35448 / organism=Chromera_velia_CCMP2878 / gene_product=hypothetical protein / transcript_product=hypothetical protein / location=Cvel_scaffold6480:252-1230(+) / protein_length=263 / sequence_SO=supercontig / SO=protein_coding / is_pseudo=false